MKNLRLLLAFLFTLAATAHAAPEQLTSPVIKGAPDFSAITNASTIRTQFGLAIGTNVQAFDADLDDLADGSLSGSKIGSGISASNITTGTLSMANGGTGVADPLFNYVRTITLSGLGASHNGNGGGSQGSSVVTQYMGATPLANGDRAMNTFNGIGGVATYAAQAYFSSPVSFAWRGALLDLPANASYGFLIGDNSTTETLSNDGYGVRVIDNNTLQLCVRVGGVTFTKNVTISGFVVAGTSPNRQCIVLRWNGSNTLELYASFAAYNAPLPAPTYRDALTQAASGAMHSTIGRFGIFSSGTSTWTTQPTMLTYDITIRE